MRTPRPRPSVVVVALQHLALHRVEVGIGLGGRGEDLVHRHGLDQVEDLLDLRLRVHHQYLAAARRQCLARLEDRTDARSEEHTSELQSLMRISYAVFCLKKKTRNNKYTYHTNH